MGRERLEMVDSPWSICFLFGVFMPGLLLLFDGLKFYGTIRFTDGIAGPLLSLTRFRID